MSEHKADDTGPEKSGQATGKRGDKTDGPIVIKKYANRRLYNTQTSSYVTLDYLSELVKAGDEFVVFDAKTGDDITRTVLTQIIFEQETKGEHLLPVQFLRQLIKFYGNSMQGYVPSYLELSMDAFARNQEAFRAQLDNAITSSPGYKIFEDSVRKNMALYEQAMKMFTTTMPGMTSFGMPRPPAPDYPREAPPAGQDGSDDTAEALRARIAELTARLNKLEGK